MKAAQSCGVKISLGPSGSLESRTAMASGSVAATSTQVNNPTALFSCTTSAPIPFSNPGLISIPLGFAFAAIGALTARERDDEKYAELEVRSLTGAGAH